MSRDGKRDVTTFGACLLMIAYASWSDSNQSKRVTKWIPNVSTKVSTEAPELSFKT